MAQEFASDNSKTGLFSRLKLSNHRGFFSFIFVTLSIIFILITFAAVQQQQTTQSKAAGNICEGFSCGLTGDVSSDSCSGLTGGNGVDWKRATCCSLKPAECVNKSGRDPNCNANCNDFNSQINNSSSTIQALGKRVCTTDSCCSFISKTCISKTVNSCSGLNRNQCEAFSSSCLFTNGNCVDKFSPPQPVPPPACVPERGQFDVLKETKSCCTTPVKLVPKLNSGSQTRVTCVKPVLLDKGRQCDPNSTTEICNPSQNIQCERITLNGRETGVCREILTGGPEINSQCQNYTGYVGHPGANQCQQAGGGCQTSQTCTALPIGSTCTFNGKPGKYTSGLCPGGAETSCCVPTTAGTGSTGPGTGSGTGGTGTKVTCTDFTTQDTCLPADQCAWITGRGSNAGKQICQRVCGRIPDQPTCDKRADCQWKDNACAVKTDGGGNEVTDSAELNLKLSFQGIVTLPKTKTELKVKVKLVDAENREKEKDASTFTADANGIWSGKVSFENVDLSQKYYLLIKGPMHVQKKICKADAADPNPGYYSCQFGNITLNSGSNDFDFSQVKMLVGDLPSPDQNGIVDREDTGIVLNSLLLPVDQRQSAETLDKSDLNLDGIVSTQDWSLMLEALKIKYDEK